MIKKFNKFPESELDFQNILLLFSLKTYKSSNQKYLYFKANFKKNELFLSIQELTFINLLKS